MGSLRPQNQKCNQTIDGSAPSSKSGLDPTQLIYPATKHTIGVWLDANKQELPGLSPVRSYGQSGIRGAESGRAMAITCLFNRINSGVMSYDPGPRAT